MCITNRPYVLIYRLANPPSEDLQRGLNETFMICSREIKKESAKHNEFRRNTLYVNTFDMRQMRSLWALIHFAHTNKVNNIRMNNIGKTD